MNRVTDKERQRVAELHAEGKGRNAIAREIGRSAGTVSSVAAQLGISFDRSAAKKATDARLAYAEERRLEIIGKGFDKADAMLEGIQDAADLQKWTVALGTLVDKARLETGEATSREERLSGDAREKHFGRLFDQLDAYRAGADEGHREGDRGLPVDSGSADDPPTRVP
jgi:transposase-like protein